MRRAVRWLFCAAILSVAAHPALAYLKLGTQSTAGGTVTLHWEDLPIRYFVLNRAVIGVTAAQLEQVVGRSFAAWEAAPFAELSSQFAGFTNAAPSLGDGASTIGFRDRPDLERVLGATNFLIDTQNGEIAESDIFLNTIFPWSVAQGGEVDRFDVESIALHEIGHLLGLGHSALGETELRPGGRRVLAAEAVMFPIAFSQGSTQGRTLKADDLAGIADIYGDDEYRDQRGSISGKVTKNGGGVLGAHVIAFNTRTQKLVGGFTLSQNGQFVIAGLEPGPYLLRVEPLDDGDIESFFDTTVDVDTNFQVKFHNRVIAVPRGGGISNVNISVVAK